MSRRKERTPSPERGRSRALRTWGFYLLALTAWVTVVLAVSITGFLLCRSILWYETNPLYQLLNWIRDYYFFVLIAAILLGWVVISYFFIGRPVRNLELLLAGAEELAHPTDTPIRLPEGMESAEAQLNQVREQALRDARAARDAEQRKNDLVVYLAHDLKTPLTSVIGYLTLLRDEPQLSPEMRGRYTGVALEKAERLEDLINEFFDITRFSLTHLELEKRDTDLRRMLEQMCSEFGPVLAGRQMRCELDLPQELRIVCDPDKMARVMDNLLNNACHYAYPGSTVYVRAWEEEKRVCMTFRNAGATIPPEKLARMFEQFFRLDTSRGTRTGNAGLGLAIAKEIVEAHGGTIAAQSAEEQVVFTVVLPR
ncbi:MAG TPA: HAMP domain-containing histidine kinase [Candidatus Flavonifractor intestinipullorum]|uniref:histidine kinase n=1 Tax=Candidatus Flavonifractor intestinipullorum TaxID=2838587 RepID=A0A9D2MCU4_9FIRM|nr:HAMP domain-containing histidine kinase [Candidatus Flavonifractor intestinipullorum]